MPTRCGQMFAGPVYQLCERPETAFPARGEWRGAPLLAPLEDEPAHDSELAFTQRETRAVPAKTSGEGVETNPASRSAPPAHSVLVPGWTPTRCPVKGQRGASESRGIWIRSPAFHSEAPALEAGFSFSVQLHRGET